jgi:hypothetical protein
VSELATTDVGRISRLADSRNATRQNRGILENRTLPRDLNPSAMARDAASSAFLGWAWERAADEVVKLRRPLGAPKRCARQNKQTCSRRGSETDRREVRNIQARMYRAVLEGRRRTTGSIGGRGGDGRKSRKSRRVGGEEAETESNHPVWV